MQAIRDGVRQLGERRFVALLGPDDQLHVHASTALVGAE